MVRLISAGINCSVRYHLDKYYSSSCPQQGSLPFDWFLITTPALPIILRDGIGDCFLPSCSTVLSDKTHPTNPCLWTESSIRGHYVMSLHDVHRDGDIDNELIKLHDKFQRRVDRLRGMLDSEDVVMVRFMRAEDAVMGKSDISKWSSALDDVCRWLIERYPHRRHRLVVLIQEDTPEFDVPNGVRCYKLHGVPFVKEKDPDEWHESHYDWQMILKNIENDYLNN